MNIDTREVETRDSESETRGTEADSGPGPAEPRLSGWRKVLVWLIGAAVLAVVGYRGALGTRMPVTERPISAVEERHSPPGDPAPSVAVSNGGVAQGRGAASSTGVGPRGEAAPNGGVAAAAPAGAEAPGLEDGESHGMAARPPGTAPPSAAGSAHGGPATPGSAGVAAADPSATAGAAGHGITPDGRIVLNLATEAELRKLPGIGKSRARAILLQRERLGRFRRVEDLLRVKGIGPRRLAALRAKVVLDAPQ